MWMRRIKSGQIWFRGFDKANICQGIKRTDEAEQSCVYAHYIIFIQRERDKKMSTQQKKRKIIIF